MKIFIVRLIFRIFPIVLSIHHFFNIWTDYFLGEYRTGYSDGQDFDFIIVGGGSSGSILANRLSLHNKVLLIEAGGSPNFLTNIPALSMLMLHEKSISYNYKTVSQNKSCLNLIERSSLWPRGKSLGGSSILNYMIYSRGNKLDYDYWSEISGDPEWSYDNLLSFFRKSEGYSGIFSNDSKYHSKTGELKITDGSYYPLFDHFQRSGKEFGYETGVDFNGGGSQTGFGKSPFTQNKGFRFSAYSAFIKPILHRQNLKILKHSSAYKIKLDKNNRAYAVEFERHGRKRIARATKEIIVSSGAVDSPKLLMLSGIGPKKHLSEIGIKTKVDLPIGQNLIDHPAALCGPFTINQTKSFIPERDLTFANHLDYFLNGKGPLASPSGLQGMAFFESSFAKKNSHNKTSNNSTNTTNYPDLQLLFLGLGIYNGVIHDFSKMIGFPQNHIEHIITPHLGKDAFFIIATLVRPQSKGEILLKDKDPSSMPLINPHYFENENDLKILTEGITICNKIGASKAFRELDAKHVPGKPIGCEMYKERSPEFNECLVKRYTATLYHPAGTVKMGKVGDKDTVVDSKLRVLNTIGLRVIDASIMPNIVNSNTNAAAILIGEKGADIIRSFWSKQYEVSVLKEYLTYNENKCFYSQIV